jgi:hypothetical protein
MSSLNTFLNRAFSVLWSPFQHIDPWIGLTVLSVVFGILALLAMKYFSNQDRIVQLKDAYKAHVLAIKLFRDDLRVVLKSLGKTLLLISFYLGHQLRPMVVMIIPFVLIFAQMQMRLAYAPLPLDEKQYVEVQLAPTVAEADVANLEVSLPPGVESAGPAVPVPSERRVVLPLVPRESGHYELEFRLGDETVTKSLRAGPDADLDMLSKVRSSSFGDLLLYPTEPSFGAGSQFAMIQVPYGIKQLPLLGIDWSFGFELGMGLTFMVLSIVAALLLKGFFGVTI